MDIRTKTLSGLIYRFGERILAQLVSLIVSIILARVLLPEDYGIVSLVTVIISLCNVLVTNGLGTALIQKKEADELDFSTICWASLGVSVALYVVLFVLAPLIGSYYENLQIVPVLRVMGLRLPIAAINSVQQAYVSKKLQFKKFFWATLSGSCVSGVVGIIMAYGGLGAWALVFQYMLSVTINTLVLFIVVRWYPKRLFSWSRFKGLFSFGWKVLAGGMITAVYEELRSLIVAGKYSTTDLSYYTKGKQFPQLLGDNVSSTIANVMFPVFSEFQNDTGKLKQAVRRSVRTSAYMLFPLLLGFATVAESFVILVLTDKWILCVPYVQLFCIMYMFKPIKHVSKSSLKALGRSDIDLAVDILEKVIGVLLIIVTMNEGVYYLAVGAVLTYFFAAIIDLIVNGKVLHYTISEQLHDILPALILALVTCGCVSLLRCLAVSAWVLLILQIVSAVIIYVCLSYVFKIDAFVYMLGTIKRMLKHRK